MTPQKILKEYLKGIEDIDMSSVPLNERKEIKQIKKTFKVSIIMLDALKEDFSLISAYQHARWVNGIKRLKNEIEILKEKLKYYDSEI